MYLTDLEPAVESVRIITEEVPEISQGTFAPIVVVVASHTIAGGARSGGAVVDLLLKVVRLQSVRRWA